YKIDAFDEVPNYSDKSTASSGKPQITESLPSPIGFQVDATMDDPNKLVLTWSDSNLRNNPNYAGFGLKRANAASGTYNIIDPQPTTTAIELITNTSYIDSGLISGEAYYYWLFSVDTTGVWSEDPAQCCKATGNCSQYYCYGIPGTDIRPPAAPTGLVAIPGTGSVALTWNSVVAPDLAGYNICRGTGTCSAHNEEETCDADSACTWVSGDCERVWTKANDSAKTYPSFTDPGLTNGTTYWYYVTAYDTSYDPATDPACDPQNRDPNDSMESSKVSATPGSTGANRTVARGWNLVAIPASTAARSPSRISLANATGNSIIFRYDAAAGQYVTEDLTANVDLGSGQAFWVHSDSDGDHISFDVEINYSTEATIPLQAGWNLIGNPFVNQFDWNDEHVQFSSDGTNFIPLSQALSSGWVKGAWLFENGSYPPLRSGDTVLPFTGFWIQTSRALTVRLKQ
ncbi:MAG: hypothetical protein ABIH66_12485, partial [bacterium]